MTENRKDFQAIYETYQPRIHRYLARIVGQDEADDLSQEVFVKVNKALPDFRGEASLSTWIYRIATNVAMDRLRSSSYRSDGAEKSIWEKEKPIEDVDMWTGAKKPSVDRQIVRREMSDCVQEFIDYLPEDYRTVLVLSEVEGLKNREIAEILGVSLDSVKIRLHRGREKLRKELETGCSFEHDEDNVLACDRKVPPKKKTE